MTETERLREAVRTLNCVSELDSLVNKVLTRLKRSEEAVEVAKNTFKFMNSQAMDWEDGATGVGYGFRSLARKALAKIQVLEKSDD